MEKRKQGGQQGLLGDFFLSRRPEAADHGVARGRPAVGAADGLAAALARAGGDGLAEERLAHGLRDADEADVRAAALGAAAEVQAVRQVRAAHGHVARQAAALLAVVL